MADYGDKMTNFTENLCVNILKDIDIKAKRNNIENKTNVDVILQNGTKIDVQYSQNFAQYGDLRIDAISAYSKGVKGEGYYTNENIPESIVDKFNNLEKEKGIKIDKIGKCFQEDDYLDATMILFYNDKLDIQDKTKQKPDSVMIITRNDIINYLNGDANKHFKNIKINNKKGLGDVHGSAFLPINAKDLKENTNCFCGTIDELKEAKDKIKKYLSK